MNAGDQIARPLASRDGYTLVGWRSDVTGEYWDFDSGRMPARDMTLSAEWRAVVTDPGTPDPPPTVITPPAIVIPVDEEDVTDPSPTPAPVTVPQQEPEDEAQDPADETAALGDSDTPLGPFQRRGVWALMNLILSILAVFMIVFQMRKVFNKEYNKDGVIRKVFYAIGVVFGVAVPILFILGNNIRNPMVFVDYLTLPLTALFLAQLIIYFFSRKKDEQDDPEDSNFELNE